MSDIFAGENRAFEIEAVHHDRTLFFLGKPRAAGNIIGLSVRFEAFYNPAAMLLGDSLICLDIP
jgi:hypothetical protein